MKNTNFKIFLVQVLIARLNSRTVLAFSLKFLENKIYLNIRTLMLKWIVWFLLDFIGFTMFQIYLDGLCLNCVEFSLNWAIQTKFKN